MFSNVAAIQSWIVSTYGNMTNQYAVFLSVVHTDNNSTTLHPHVRYCGWLTKDTGGNSIVYQAADRFGRTYVMAYEITYQVWDIYQTSTAPFRMSSMTYFNNNGSTTNAFGPRVQGWNTGNNSYIDNIKVIRYTNGFKHICGLFTITAGADMTGNIVENLTQNYSCAQSSVKGQQGWCTVTNIATGISYICLFPGSYLAIWNHAAPAGQYCIDYWYY